MIKIKENVLFQKDYRIAETMSIFEYALSNPQEIDPTAPIAVISVDNSYMELNLSGALIYESIGNKESILELSSKFVQLFGLTNEKANDTITRFYSKLIEKGIIEETSD